VQPSKLSGHIKYVSVTVPLDVVDVEEHWAKNLIKFRTLLVI